MDKKLFLFDVDGTIAESSKEININILKILIEKKQENFEYGIISGGKYEKLLKQIGEENIINSNPLFDYVFCENGMIGYKNNNLIFERNLDEIYKKDKIEEIITFIKHILSEFILDNQFIKFELRKSLIYFSPAGINANDSVRNNFMKDDEKFKIRENIMKILKDQLLKKFNLKICLGGNLGFAIHPLGWDKSYVLRKKLLDFKNYEKIYFFGDRCHLNGNDYEIYNHHLTTGFNVTSPRNTFDKLSDLFNKI